MLSSSARESHPPHNHQLPRQIHVALRLKARRCCRDDRVPGEPGRQGLADLGRRQNHVLHVVAPGSNPPPRPREGDRWHWGRLSSGGAIPGRSSVSFCIGPAHLTLQNRTGFMLSHWLRRCPGLQQSAWHRRPSDSRFSIRNFFTRYPDFEATK